MQQLDFALRQLRKCQVVLQHPDDVDRTELKEKAREKVGWPVCVWGGGGWGGLKEKAREKVGWAGGGRDWGSCCVV